MCVRTKARRLHTQEGSSFLSLVADTVGASLLVCAIAVCLSVFKEERAGDLCFLPACSSSNTENARRLHTKVCSLSCTAHTGGVGCHAQHRATKARAEAEAREPTHTCFAVRFSVFKEEKQPAREREREREKRHVFHVNKKEIRIRAEDEIQGRS